MSPVVAVLGRLRSLQLRFMLIVVLGALLFAALAGGLAYRLGRDRALADSRATLDGLASAIEKTVAIGVFARDRVLLQELVGSLALNELVGSAEVQDARGARLVGSRRVDTSLSTAANSTISITRVLVSPFDRAERIGRLVILADQAKIGATATKEAYTLALMMAGQTASVALLLYAVAAWLVSRPIVGLARKLGGLEPGTTERLSTSLLHRHDEIGALINGANALLDANANALSRERALRGEVQAMEAQYRQIFESSSAGIFVLDASSGRLINSNPTVSKVVGLSVDQMRLLRSENFIDRIFGEPEQVRNMIDRAMRLGETAFGDIELVGHGNLRRWVHCLISVQGGASSQAGSIRAASTMVEGVIYDITDRKRAEHMARHRSEHDALTNLRNRASSDATIDRLVAEAAAVGGQISLLCIDLDGFKSINDTLGHHAGDQVLVACASRMRAVVRRASDLVGRLGGDEFVVALRDVGPSDNALAETAAALLEGLTQPLTLDDGTMVRIGASIGIACMPLHGFERSALMRVADSALYAVKRGGKNSYAIAHLDALYIGDGERRFQEPEPFERSMSSNAESMDGTERLKAVG